MVAWSEGLWSIGVASSSCTALEMSRRERRSRQEERNKQTRCYGLVFIESRLPQVFPVGVHNSTRRNEPLNKLVAFTPGRMYGKRCICSPGMVRRKPLVPLCWV
jgi:hypothetical protein